MTDRTKFTLAVALLALLAADLLLPEQPFTSPLREFVRDEPEVVTALATAVISIYTIMLAIATDKLSVLAEYQQRDMAELLRTADKSARAAMKSADVSERSLIELERARLFPRIPDAARVVLPPGVRRDAVVPYCFFNFGKTPATIQQIAVKVQLGKHDRPPPLESGYTALDLWEPVIPGVSSEARACEIPEAIYRRFDELLAGAGDDRLFLVGRVKYRDVFDNLHTRRFCYKAVRSTTGGLEFWTRGGEEYNKEITEQPAASGL